MGYAALIGAVIQGGIAIYNANQSPNYPSPPVLRNIDIPFTKAQSQRIQERGYALSDKRFAERYPLLAKGKAYEMGSIEGEMKGPVSSLVRRTLNSTNLEPVPQGNEFQVAHQLGLPITAKLDRDRKNLNRVISENPERVGPLSGTQVATLMANNYKNVNSFNQQLLGIQANNYAGAANQYAQNVAAIGPAIGGGANALSNALQLGYYQQGQTYGQVPVYQNASDVSNPGRYVT